MSVLKPISAVSLAEETFAKLVGAITAGEFKPGERLSEADLARRLGISRGPLREALGRLEGRLVTRTPRIGVHIINLSQEDLEMLFTLREALEGMACRLAAQRIKDHELESLRALLDQHHSDSAVLNPTGYYQRTQDDDFHFQVVKCARNIRIETLLMREIYYQLRLYRFQASSRAGRAEEAFREHEDIYKALAARDPDRAEAAMRRHVRNAFESLKMRTAYAPEEAQPLSRAAGR